VTAVCANCARECPDGDLWTVTRPDGPRDACGPICARTLDEAWREWEPGGRLAPHGGKSPHLDGLFGFLAEPEHPAKATETGLRSSAGGSQVSPGGLEAAEGTEEAAA
jgi:hypothetical protein